MPGLFFQVGLRFPHGVRDLSVNHSSPRESRDWEFRLRGNFIDAPESVGYYSGVDTSLVRACNSQHAPNHVIRVTLMIRYTAVLLCLPLLLSCGSSSETGDAATGVTTAAMEGVESILSSVTKSSFSADQLKASIASLSVEDVGSIADKVMTAVQSQDGIVKQLTEQAKTLGAEALANSPVKAELDSATSLLSELKGKLTVLVDKLKEGGIDVSKYASLLGA